MKHRLDRTPFLTMWYISFLMYRSVISFTRIRGYPLVFDNVLIRVSNTGEFGVIRCKTYNNNFILPPQRPSCANHALLRQKPLLLALATNVVEDIWDRSLPSLCRTWPLDELSVKSTVGSTGGQGLGVPDEWFPQSGLQRHGGRLDVQTATLKLHILGFCGLGEVKRGRRPRRTSIRGRWLGVDRLQKLKSTHPRCKFRDIRRCQNTSTPASSRHHTLISGKWRSFGKSNNRRMITPLGTPRFKGSGEFG